jgi:poly-gamma-glutamate synthesis protein (capsule biosynthesis protein)
MIRSDSNGKYDFKDYYSEIKPLVEKADLAFINQETVLAGESFGYSGYPEFNTPQEAGDALIDAGFDIINHATNHIMDKGGAAVTATMDYWDSKKTIPYTGIFRSEQERNTKTVIVEINTIKLGFLAYTYGTNYIPLPKDKPWLVALISDEALIRDVDALRPLCDFLVVSMHWGEEYEQGITAEQERLAALLAGHGADLILGHHPHVVEPYAYIPRADGGTTLCFYSLGNFISAQTRQETLLGALAYVRLKKEGNTVTIDKAGVIPTVTHYEQGYTKFKVYPLYGYTNELGEKHRGRQAGNKTDTDYFNALAESIFPRGVIKENPF